MLRLHQGGGKVATPISLSIPVEDKPRAFKVDTVREIRSSAYIVPNEADRKVVILENAHTMGPEGRTPC